MKTKLGLYLLATVMLLMAGCDLSDDDTVLDQLPVDPPSAILSGWPASVILTADVSTGGNTGTVDMVIYPLEWEVSDPSIGRIAARSANQAVYVQQARRSSLNVITVKDQMGRRGVATVEWSSSPVE